MSMNVYIYAEYEVLNLKNKQKRTLQESFGAWQTPTEDTYRIVRSDDPIKAYCDWVLKVSEEEVLERYAPDDFMSEGPVIGYDTHHPGEEHVAELMEWVERVREIGTVKVEVV